MNVNQSQFGIALSRVKQGKLVGVPTETVYGLAARIDLPLAIESIFKVKQRPFFDPLIIHVGSIEQAKTLTPVWPLICDILASKFWPGPLTMILPKNSNINPMISSGLETVGIRMPNHPLTLELIQKLNVPIAAPSANKFGRTSPSKAKHVKEEFQDDDVFVLDGGDCQIGIESTVLSIKKEDARYVLSILRKGHVVKSDIEKILNDNQIAFEFCEPQSIKDSPGHMKHHYMPKIPLFIVAKKMDESVLLENINSSFEAIPDEVDSVKIIKPRGKISKLTELRLSNDPVLACRELYSKMRSCAENTDAQAIYFVKKDFHQGERWECLFDRLNKAATLIFSTSPKRLTR
jgi:L-threonylcarbamoyladenylate synthase